VAWVRRYVRFHGLRHPRDLGADALDRYLSWLAVRGLVSAPTQNQARSALVFPYGTVLAGDAHAPAAATPLARHLVRVWALRACDLARGAGSVALPGALARKFPNAAREWGWQWVFSAARPYRDATDGAVPRRH
jgi:hypothetical protein